MYVHFDSCHPYHVKTAVPYGQFIRLRRINSDYKDFLSQAQELMDRLRARGYPEEVLSPAFQKAINMERNTLIHKNRKKRINDRFVFSFQHSPMSNKIKQVIRNNWHILSHDSDLREAVSKPPIISFRRCKNLRSELVSSGFSATNNKSWLSNVSGNHKCGNCSFCPQMLKCKSLEIGGKYFNIQDLITCRSKFVTYAIFCPCKYFYIGKTNRNLFIRFREHCRSITTGKGSPRLIEHVRKCHNSDAQVLTFAGIQKVAYHVPDKHVTLLKMESRLILNCNALGPLGLNDRNDYSMFL